MAKTRAERTGSRQWRMSDTTNNPFKLGMRDIRAEQEEGARSRVRYYKNEVSQNREIPSKKGSASRSSHGSVLK